MDFKQFRYVLKVAELQNITLASKELYVSQPSLSSYIKKIEEELGAKIFNRGTNPISLTEVGERYIETGNIILSLYGELLEDVSAMTLTDRGKLIVGIPHSRAAYMLPVVLPEFSEVYPNISVETLEAKSAVLMDYVKRGKVDFAIIPLNRINFEHSETIDYETIYKEQLYLISGKPLLNETMNDGEIHVLENLDPLIGEKFVLLEKGHGIRFAIDRVFKDHNFTPKVLMKTTSNETAFRLATSGHGLAIVPEISLAMFNSKRKPFVYKLGTKGIAWEIVAVYKSSESENMINRKFINMLEEKFTSEI